VVAVSYEEVRERVEAAAVRAGRDPESITLVAVSKTMSPEQVLAVYESGHRDFGENRAQEMAEKAAVLPDDIRWHFVGSLQANKARLVRPRAHLLHSMDRESLAVAWVKGSGTPPPVLIQVNTGLEPQKSGVEPGEVGALAVKLADLGVPVLGLMAIPPLSEDPERMRPHFSELRGVRDKVVLEHPTITGLSMGMSDDYEVAIEEGASVIRVGRAIFGPRT
jgi:hypothetical protein